MTTLRMAGFGMRGRVGDSLDPVAVIQYVSAFAAFSQGGDVIVGRDTRNSSPMLHDAVVSALLSSGCRVLDAGICPVGLLQWLVRHQGTAGAVSISGGHNAAGWNSLTLVGPDGAYLEPVSGESVLDRFHARDFLYRDWSGVGRWEPLGGYASPYFRALAEQLNVEAIRAADLHILVDPVGGAGCPFLDDFARTLGVRMMPVNGEPSGYLAREPEPRPRVAVSLASVTRHVHGHVGFILSSDLARMSLVSNLGEPASEEYTFALIADHILGRTPGTLVTNVCTSRMVDDLARRYQLTVVKTPVGLAYLTTTLADEQGILAGEGSGSVVLPSFSMGSDGFLMMGLVLEALAESGETLAQRLERLPRYHVVKRSTPCPSIEAFRAVQALKDARAGLEPSSVNLTDGIRMDWPDGWVHARSSKTQQLIRVVSEAETRPAAEQRAHEVLKVINQEL